MIGAGSLNFQVALIKEDNYENNNNDFSYKCCFDDIYIVVDLLFQQWLVDNFIYYLLFWKI